MFIFPAGARANASLSSCYVVLPIKKLFGGLQPQAVIRFLLLESLIVCESLLNRGFTELVFIYQCFNMSIG